MQLIFIHIFIGIWVFLEVNVFLVTECIYSNVNSIVFILMYFTVFIGNVFIHILFICIGLDWFSFIQYMYYKIY